MVPSTLCLLSLLILTAPLQLPKTGGPEFPRPYHQNSPHQRQPVFQRGNALPQSSPATQRERYAECREQRGQHNDYSVRRKAPLQSECKEKTYASFPIEDWEDAHETSSPYSAG